MAEMARELEGELGGMSDATKAQLAHLATQSGKAIAALMRDETMSAEAKAEALAKIKQQTREDAQKVLAQNSKASLAAENAERKIGVATKDIENTVQRIAQID